VWLVETEVKVTRMKEEVEDVVFTEGDAGFGHGYVSPAESRTVEFWDERIRVIDVELEELAERAVVLRQARRRASKRRSYIYHEMVEDRISSSDFEFVKAVDIVRDVERGVLEHGSQRRYARAARISTRTIRHILHGTREWVTFGAADRLLNAAGSTHRTQAIPRYDRGSIQRTGELGLS
jgi:hypothetical protein